MNSICLYDEIIPFAIVYLALSNRKLPFAIVESSFYMGNDMYYAHAYSTRIFRDSAIL